MPLPSGPSRPDHAMPIPEPTPSAAPYRLPHGAALTDAQAAHLLTRAAQGEALNWAPVKTGPRWVLAHVATLSPAERADHARQVRLTADLIAGRAVPALLKA